jgi:hypothetical protein
MNKISMNGIMIDIVETSLPWQHLTKSKMIANVYGFCANSGFFDYADGGSMADVIWPSKGRI